ncbi:hypothetical protein SMCF_7492 [Streptomyces coelicoflavus ZG0656]|nr:hypothetical protein SMCF_7492 [Streptomyces coelicoflavus ZG0656]
MLLSLLVAALVLVVAFVKQRITARKAAAEEG